MAGRRVCVETSPSTFSSNVTQRHGIDCLWHGAVRNLVDAAVPTFPVRRHILPSVDVGGLADVR